MSIQTDVYRDAAGEWRFRIAGANHEILAMSSESYKRRRSAQEALYLIVRPKPPATDEARLEAAARAHAGLGVDDPWPTNEALGGSLTGTRDLEFRDGCMEEAAAILQAADNADPLRERLRVMLDNLNDQPAGMMLTAHRVNAMLEELRDGRP